MSNSNGFKAQWKPYATAQWQTKLAGTEASCLNEYTRLKDKYPFARVIDSDGRTVT